MISMKDEKETVFNYTSVTSIPINKPVEKLKDPYWDRISDMAANQRKKGIAEYGKGIEDDIAGIQERLTRIQEELIDALYYIEHLKDGIQ